MISLDAARQIILANVQPLPAERRSLMQACGAILREEITALDDSPAFDRAAMDGYAVGADDPSLRFRVIGEVQAGAVAAHPITPGESVRIFTGAAIPDGATQVIMQEDVRREGEWMIPLKRHPATHIRRRGTDARAGDVLLSPGQRIGPAEAGLLAHIGKIDPLVSRSARVLHLVTGNELVDPSQTPAAGEIRDSNSALIAGLLAEQRAKLIGQHRCGDTLPALIETAGAHDADSWDMLLISGGASVGNYDFGAPFLRELGFTIHFDRINLRPGKPTIFGTKDRRVAFVIPGNPVSHFVVYHVAIRLALEVLAGVSPEWSLIEVRLESALPEQSDRRETYWPARVSVKNGALMLHPLAWKNSGNVGGLVSVNALLHLPAKGLGESSLARCLLLDPPGTS